MRLAGGTSGNRGKGPTPGYLLLPALAFLGLLLLAVFGGENWVYSQPFSDQKPQTLTITTDPLRGLLLVPKTVFANQDVEVGGWIQSLSPAIQPQQVMVYLDGRPVGETKALLRLPAGSNADAATILGWKLDFSVRDARPGEHELSVQAVLTGHEPVTVAHTSLSVTQ